MEVLSHAIHGFSKFWPDPATAIGTGFVQVRPPVVERLASTATPMGLAGPGVFSASETAIHTLWRASKATDGSRGHTARAGSCRS